MPQQVRFTRERFTPQEGSIASDLPLSTVQKAVSKKQVPARLVSGRRMIHEVAVLALALTKKLPPTVRLGPKEAHELLTRAGIGSIADVAGFLPIGGSVRVDLTEALGEAVRRLRLLRRARDIVVRNPDINDGLATIRGTTITIDSLRARIERRQTIVSILEEHPELDEELIEASILWARANPARGRPKRPMTSVEPSAALRPTDMTTWTRTMRITARQVDAWAATKGAQSMLPRLIRRLIQQTGRIVEASVPAGESTSQPGWDGAVTSDEGNAWVPRGQSFWEISCDSCLTKKANSDYRKRTKATSRALRKRATFIVVMGRSWGPTRKKVWLKQRRREHAWREVRAYDADTLEQWLEESPAIALQFANELGLMGHGVESPLLAWQAWSAQCAPPISPESLYAGRELAKKHFLSEIRRRIATPELLNPLSIRADSVDEAVAFACATLMENPELIASSLVVTDTAGWQFVEANPLLKVAVTARPEFGERPTRRQGLVIVIPYAAGDITSTYRGAAVRDSSDIVLPRAHHHEFERALVRIGLDEAEAKRLSSSTGRSWSVLRRHRATNPALRRPAWLDMPCAESLSTVCLLGAWSADIAGDREVVSRVACRSHDAVERDLKQLSSVDDAPILEIGGVWKAKSPLELMDLLGGRITREQLDRFFVTARDALAEADPVLELPEEQRWAAQAYGGRPRPYSGLLIDSLCNTLTKLAVRGPQVPALQALLISYRVEQLVRDLLSGCDATRWLSLSSFLPALAEAAPDEFLGAVEASLGRVDAPVTRLLTEGAGDSGMTGRCWHAGLLWALELLAWAPERLARVALLLTRLTKVPIPGNWGNSPHNSLLAIFRSWIPQTSAPLEQRIAVIDTMIKNAPHEAFALLDRLVVFHSDAATPSMRPRWREDDANSGHVISEAEIRSMLTAAADRLIACSRRCPEWIARVLHKVEWFDPPRVEAALCLVRDLIASSRGDADREIVRSAIRRILFFQKNYVNDNRPPFAALDTLETLYDELAPVDVIARYRWLFAEPWPQLPERVRDEGGHEHGKMLEHEQLKAIHEVVSEQGLAGVARLGSSCTRTGTVGVSLAKLSLDSNELAQWIAALDCDLDIGHPLSATLSGLLHATGSENALPLLETVLRLGKAAGWDAAKEARLLVLARAERATWHLAASRSPAVEAAYWQLMVPGRLLHDDDAEFSHVLQRLLAAGRPRAAFDACLLSLDRVDSSLLLEMLEGVLRGDESGTSLPDTWYLAEAIDALESSSSIDRERLIRLEFTLIAILPFGTQQRAKSLYAAIAASPQLFTDLICLVYRARNAPAQVSEEPSPQQKMAARAAWHVLTHFERQPGTRADGSTDPDAVSAFVDHTRDLCRQADRLEICDETLGQVLSAVPAGSDGSWPFEAVRPILDRHDLDGVRRGFVIGAMNRRGVTTRAFDDGGDQERALAGQYRGYARALRVRWPNLASALDELAHHYEESGRREDLAARLRVESS